MVFWEEVEFFSDGVIQGAVDQNMELILHRFESKVVKVKLKFASWCHNLFLGKILDKGDRDFLGYAECSHNDLKIPLSVQKFLLR